ncbi:hypothetical protein Hanom_Chr08g00720931 [Helianthus anomalus]
MVAKIGNSDSLDFHHAKMSKLLYSSAVIVSASSLSLYRPSSLDGSLPLCCFVVSSLTTFNMVMMGSAIV